MKSSTGRRPDELGPRPKAHGESAAEYFLRIGEKEHTTRRTVDLQTGLARAMKGLARRFFRPLGLACFVVDYRSARRLVEICSDVREMPRNGEPWPEELLRFADAFVREARRQQAEHP